MCHSIMQHAALCGLFAQVCVRCHGVLWYSARCGQGVHCGPPVWEQGVSIAKCCGGGWCPFVDTEAHYLGHPICATPSINIVSVAQKKMSAKPHTPLLILAHTMPTSRSSCPLPFWCWPNLFIDLVLDLAPYGEPCCKPAFLPLCCGYQRGQGYVCTLIPLYFGEIKIALIT